MKTAWIIIAVLVIVAACGRVMIETHHKLKIDTTKEQREPEKEQQEP